MSNPRRNITILFATLTIVMLGFGIIIPILPFYIKAFGAGGKALGTLMAIYAVMQFLFAPLWGSLSDRYGRKPILILGVTGNALSHLLFGLSTELWMLYAARALAGILSSATLPTAMAYIGDSTPVHERGGGMGKLSAAIGLGVVLGPGLGGWLAAISLSVPFFVASALSLLALVPIVIMLPESLPHDNRHRRAVRLGTAQIASMLQALAGPIAFLLFLAFLLDFGFTNFEAIFGLFSLERYGYGPEQVGTVLVMIGIISTIMQGGLAGPLTRRWGEATVIKVSLIGCAAGFLLMLIPDSVAGVLLAVGFYIVSNALLRPCVAALISKRAEGGQGQAMGLNNSFQSLGRIGGPVFAGMLFDFHIYLPYICGSAICLAGFILSLNKLDPRRKKE